MKQFTATLILIPLLFAAAIHASTTVSQTVSPNNYTIGDPLHYQTIITVPATLTLKEKTAPNITNTAITTLEQSLRISTTNTETTITIDYSLAVFDISEQQIPTQQLTLIHNESKEKTELNIPAKTLLVKKTVPENTFTTQINNVFYRERDLDWGPLIAAFFGIILALTSIFWAVTRWKNKDNSSLTEPIPIDPRSSLERAQDALDTLTQQLPAQDITQHYVRFSEIIKQFLSELLGTHVVEMTSAEVLSLSRQHLDEQNQRRLKHLLTFSDSIKFAKGDPSLDDQEQLHDKAKETLHRIHKATQVNTEEKSSS